jgi:hypothetical protein
MKKNLFICTDNCPWQNKNRGKMTLWLSLDREGIFKSIEHRFIVTGHTHLPSHRKFVVLENHARCYYSQLYDLGGMWIHLIKS